MRTMSQKQQQKFTRGKIERDRGGIVVRSREGKPATRKSSPGVLMSQLRRGLFA